MTSLHPHGIVGTRKLWRGVFVLGGMLLALTLGAGVVRGQTFTSGSTGADGALDFSGLPQGTIIDFDPTALTPPRDIDGDSVYHFTTITIPAGVTIRFRANKARYAPIYWLATGAVVINGILDLDGENGHDSSPSTARIPSVPGPGGFAGGIGARVPNIKAQAGFGPGGGCATGISISVAYSAGHATGSPFSDAGCPGGVGSLSYGNAFLLPLIGGSGGAGGGGAASVITSNGYGGGAGGGAIMIASSVSISLNGTIHANGGGVTGSSSGTGAGAGSGGAIRLVAPAITGNGTLSTEGGFGNRVVEKSRPGRIRIEVLQNTFTGTLNGNARVATLVPNPILLPTGSLGTLRIVSVGGQAVPNNPQGSFNPVDVTLNTTQPVAIVLEGKNIPPGTPVTVTIVNETEGSQIVTSLPLAGTAALSTASATATIPAGFSRLFTYAKWSQ